MAGPTISKGSAKVGRVVPGYGGQSQCREGGPRVGRGLEGGPEVLLCRSKNTVSTRAVSAHVGGQSEWDKLEKNIIFCFLSLFSSGSLRLSLCFIFAHRGLLSGNIDTTS